MATTGDDKPIGAYGITLTELDGLEHLAGVVGCAQLHALAPEVQAALQWIADVRECANIERIPKPAPRRWKCIIDDASYTVAACGPTSQAAEDEARKRFQYDVGRPPAPDAQVEVYSIET